jgi:hypothetical protein
MTNSINDQVHSECSPSQLNRIILCPGSRRLKRLIDEPVSNVYAEEGTLLHEITEYRIKKQLLGCSDSAKALVEPTHQELTMEQEIAIDDCIDYFNGFLYEIKNIADINMISMEKSTDCTYFGCPECNGRTDLIIESEQYDFSKRKDIIDWKFGKGIKVFAENNVQGLGYAAGSFKSFDEMRNTKIINIHIVQPRLDHYDTWQISGDYLYRWIQSIMIPAVKKSRDPNAKCIPGEEQCKWCVGPICKARLEMVNSIAAEIFSKNDEPINIKDIANDEDIAHLLEKAQLLDGFIKDLKTYALSKALSTTGFPGYKAVAGKSFRSWRDEKETQDTIIKAIEIGDIDNIEFDDIFETKLLSVAKLEKLLKKAKNEDWFKRLYYKSAGKPTLVPQSDPREPYTKSAKSVFEQYVK